MVEGLELFKTHFADFTDQYVLIGGAACTVAMENVGQVFRATKDLDIVLCVEVLDANFATAFWQFVRDGQYETQEKATGERQFYRFTKPQTAGYPFMLELFSRTLDALTPAAGSDLTPIPFDDEISNLSAILLDDDYYSFLQTGKQVIDGVQIVGAEHLIPLKARAWLDLTERKNSGKQVDSKNIKKHKNDVFRLFAIVDPDFDGPVPAQVKSDLGSFLERMPAEALDLKMLGLGHQTLDSVTTVLRRIYGL
ncbi:MAG: hypothetical protein ACC628_15855 [Pirellulaceae bacterium]